MFTGGKDAGSVSPSTPAGVQPAAQHRRAVGRWVLTSTRSGEGWRAENKRSRNVPVRKREQPEPLNTQNRDSLLENL